MPERGERVEDLIRRLDEAYSQGKISRETYESMRRKYESRLSGGKSGVAARSKSARSGGGRAKLGMAVAAAGLVLIVVGAAGMAGLIPGLGGQHARPHPPPPPPPPPAGGQGQQGGGQGQQGGPDLASLLSGSREWWVTYDFTGTSEGQSTSGTMELAVKGGKIMYKISTTAQGQPVQFMMISTPEGIVQCTMVPGQGWMCYRAAQSQQQTYYVDPVGEARKESQTETPVYIGTRIYAGETSYCYAWESTGSEACFTGDGIPTYFKGQSSGGSVEREATSVQRSAPDSLFRPPAPPSEMPGFGGGGG